MSARTEQTLECDFCGCYSDKPGKGWTGYRQDGGLAPPWDIVYCPKCAVDELGHGADIAADHVCVFEAPEQSFASRLLECDFCGCYSYKPGRGWAGYRKDAFDGIAGHWVAVYCPKCAADVFGHRPDVAADYVCVFPRPLA